MTSVFHTLPPVNVVLPAKQLGIHNGQGLGTVRSNPKSVVGSAWLTSIPINIKEIQMKCSICGHTIKPDVNGWSGGHNPWPINGGKCCGKCNDEIVVPRRIYDAFDAEIDKDYIQKGMKLAKQVADKRLAEEDGKV